MCFWRCSNGVVAAHRDRFEREAAALASSSSHPSTKGGVGGGKPALEKGGGGASRASLERVGDGGCVGGEVAPVTVQQPRKMEEEDYELPEMDEVCVYAYIYMCMCIRLPVRV